MLYGTSTANLVRLPLSELQIEQELNLARASGGERLQKIGAEHWIDLSYVSAIEQVEGFGYEIQTRRGAELQ